jgi:hypothetical protein
VDEETKSGGAGRDEKGFHAMDNRCVWGRNNTERRTNQRNFRDYAKSQGRKYAIWLLATNPWVICASFPFARSDAGSAWAKS